MREYQLDLDSLLLQLQVKLQKRNPKIFSKDLRSFLSQEMHEDKNILTIGGLRDYRKYIKKAFSVKPVENRGDYLIVGMYRMFYQAFDRDKFHKISALQYDPEKIQRAYAILQVISWKIKTAKDKNGNYLFLTWQNNWQVELQKRLNEGKKLSMKLINSLKYIKDKKESLLSASNLSFESIFGKMFFVFQKALKTVGVEPKSLGAEALKNFIMFL